MSNLVNNHRTEYDETIDMLYNNITQIENLIEKLGTIKEDASNKVKSNENVVNDVLHFLEFEAEPVEQALITASKKISDNRKERRESKMVLQDISNIQKYAGLTFGDLCKHLQSMKNSIETYISMSKKELVYNPRAIDFEEIKGAQNV